MNELIVTDRTTGTKYLIEIVDGEFKLTSSVGTADSEPVIIDEYDSSRWKFFVDSGEWAIETTADPYVGVTIIYDSTAGVNYRLYVNDGNFGWIALGIAPRFRTTKINRVFRTTAHRVPVITAQHRMLIRGIK